MNQSTKKILVYIPTGGLGDGFQMIPFFQALHEAFPDHALFWAQRFDFDLSPLLLSVCPYLTAVVNLHLPDSPRALWSLKSDQTSLGQHHFDLVFDLSKRLKHSLFLKYRLSHDVFLSIYSAYRLSDKKPALDYKKQSSYRRNTNNLHQALDLLSMITHCFYTYDTQLHVGARYQQAARALLPADQHYIGFVPDGAKAKKLWPIDRYIALAQHYLQRGFVPVFFVGPGHDAVRAQIQSAIPQVIFAPLLDRTDANSVYSAPYYIALAECMELVVTNDCGPAHVLNCANQPMIFLFGRSNPHKYILPRPGIRVIQAQQWQSNDINAIPVEAVMNAVDAVLAKRSL